VAFEIFGAIPPAGRPVFDFGQDGCSGRLRAREMRIEIFDVDQNPVDDPGDGRPFARLLARFAMPLRRP